MAPADEETVKLDVSEATEVRYHYRTATHTNAIEFCIVMVKALLKQIKCAC